MDSIEIIISIRKIVRSLNIESKGLQKDFGLSIPQILCLGHLENQPYFQSTHKELMEFLSLNSSTVTGIIGRLEKRGYVARLSNSNDRRLRSIVLTASGKKLLDETPNILHDRLSARLNSLSEEQNNMIKDSLTIIISAMNIKTIDAAPLLISGETTD